MENRNEIKKRMFVTAAKAWGITAREMETIDPLVTMLIDAISNELEIISATVDDAGRRAGLKLMELLTPESLLSPVPARAILHARPFDNNGKVTPDHEFYYYKRNPFENETNDLGLFFTPVREHRIFSGEVEYFAAGSTLFRIDDSNDKTMVCRTFQGKSFSNSIWMGLSLNRNIVSLDGLSFFFETDNLSDIQETVFHQALLNSTWKVNGKPVRVNPGFYDIPGTGNRKQIKLPYTEFNKSVALTTQVAGIYQKNFVSFTDNQWDKIYDQESFNKYPPLFTELFDQVHLEKIDKRLLWVEVCFPAHIPQELADQVKCTLNCFPVVGLRKEKCVITGNDRIKELKAEPHEVFFDLASVTCNDQLEIILGGKIPENMEGKAILTLRKDNIARFNTSNAVEQIQQMIESYRAEYGTFSKIRGLEHDAIDKLFEAIRPFEYAIDTIREYTSGSTPYMMLKTDPAREDAEVEVTYYLTCGSLGNGLSKGVHINFDSAELVRDKIYLVTATTGGSDVKRDDELVRNFRYAMLTHGRLVTLEDIRALCDVRLGRYAETIEVKKGVAASTQFRSGLQRVIEINIHLKRDTGLTREEIKALKESLEQELEEKSANVMPYRVRVE
jgi:hypothetical protein